MDSLPKQAVILCGGQGSRIRDVSEALPKPMLSIGKFPILWHIMQIYVTQGVRTFILCLGYKSWQVKEFFLNYRAMTSDFRLRLGDDTPREFFDAPDPLDVEIVFAETGEHAETGARVWKVRQYLEGEREFFFTYGDAVADLSLSSLYKCHTRLGTVGTFSGVHPPSRFGEYEEDEGRVTHFNEKPNISFGSVNGGFMVFDNTRIWDWMREGDDLVLESEVLGQMTKAGEFGVYRHDGFWQCMDTPREHRLLNHLWHSGNAPWKLWS